MTLAQLRYAITVAGASSMNEAARKLFISQPSLSAAIKELEEEVGVELFKRTNRGISVTLEGEEFIGYARQVVEQYNLIESKYILKENTKKKFGVSMQHYTFAVKAFVEMVKQFGMDEYEFEIHETKTYDVIEDVKNCKSEIGILYLNDFNKKVLTKLFHESAVEFHELLKCHIYVYLWKGHPLASKEEITLEELEELFNIHFECEDIDTINGYMIYKLGKIPEEQEQFQMECGGYLFDVAEVADKMIRKVRVTKIQEKEQTTENE